MVDYGLWEEIAVNNVRSTFFGSNPIHKYDSCRSKFRFTCKCFKYRLVHV